MKVSYCYGCMEPIAEYPCPKCGYAPRNNTTSYALQPGTILSGKYLIGKVLGQGGFGITYLGLDLQLQRKVAIKEYYPSGFVSRKGGTSNVIWYASEAAWEARQTGLEMVLKEARKMSKVGNIPAVVKVFNVFQENGTAYICMDYIQGQTLLDRLKRTGPLSWEAAKTLFLPVIQSMEQVHQIGLIHRDISPDNLMIQPNGSVKILDLGAAKDLNRNTGHSSLQVAKNGFSPLEQYMHSGNSGSWTDVYAMAATMYYALTGVLPPSALDRTDKDLLRWDLPQLRTLPPEVCRALQHAMAVRSAERTQTMTDFLQELQSKGRKPPKLPKKWLIAAVVILVTVVATVAGLSLSRDSALPSSTTQPKPAVLTNAPSEEQLHSRIRELIDTCTLETYDFRNGARMEFYFDSQDNECLRIFVNEDGKDQFTILAEYDAEGNALEEYGFEYQTLSRYIIWHRNAEGKTTERLEYQAGHVLIERMQYSYDAKGREISRIGTNQDGQTIFQGTSTYDTAGRETYTGVNEEGNHFEYLYSADGNLLEYTIKKPSGEHVNHTSFTYDTSGKTLEYISYNEKGEISHRQEYHYNGELQTGYTWYSYYTDNLSTTEYQFIFGPRDIRIGNRNLDEKYGSDMEYVRDMFSSWNFLDFQYNINDYSANYEIFRYDWGKYLGSDGFDEDGNLIKKSTELYDASGKNTGSEYIHYASDGTYSVTLYDGDFNWVSEKDYNRDGRLLSETIYQYDTDGNKTGSVKTEYKENGSYTETKVDASYHDLVSRTYDSSGTLISMVEYTYEADGTRAGSISTVYYNDGSYTVTVTKGYSEVVSRKTYDADGRLIS